MGASTHTDTDTDTHINTHTFVLPREYAGEDLAAPLVHELSYQCAVYDFLSDHLDGDV